MFSFDHWADWFNDKVGELDSDRFVLVKSHDTREIPECRSNPSFGLQLDSDDRIGFIGFWKNGLCDYLVLDVHSEEELANEAGLEASDETIPSLFANFLSYYG